jgi:fumarate hydratase class II
MSTALTPVIGYEKAAAISNKAHKTGKTIREVAVEEQILPEKDLEKLLDPRKMT